MMSLAGEYSNRPRIGKTPKSVEGQTTDHNQEIIWKESCAVRKINRNILIG